MRIDLTLLAGAATGLGLASRAAPAQDLPACENCADGMTIVSWGGAYQASQQKAYAEPYVAETGINVIWDESSNEAVAKLRAQIEAGNVTWDLVDVEGPDSQRLCDEGLAAEIDFDTALAPGDRRLDPDRRLRRQPDQRVLHPADRLLDDLRLPHRRGRVERQGARQRLRRLRPRELPRQAQPGEAPKKNLEWALLCDGVAKDELYDVLSTEEGVRARARQARHHQGQRRLVVGRRRDAAAPRRQARW